MTESEWEQATDPHIMIDFLSEERTHFRTRWLGWLGVHRFRISERKWKLFYCACCRRIQHLLPVPESRSLIDVVERHADGQASEDDVERAIAACMSACQHDSAARGEEGMPWSSRSEAVNAIGRFHRGEDGGRRGTLRAAARALAADACDREPPTGDRNAGAIWEGEQVAEFAYQADLLRDIVGNPFRQSILDEHWLAWNDGTVRRLAEKFYSEGRFDELPILADALEDAGCTDEVLLSHCRFAAEHVRGCWVLDLLLNKK